MLKRPDQTSNLNPSEIPPDIPVDGVADNSNSLRETPSSNSLGSNSLAPNLVPSNSPNRSALPQTDGSSGPRPTSARADDEEQIDEEEVEDDDFDDEDDDYEDDEYEDDDEEEDEDDSELQDVAESWLDSDTKSFLISMLVHVGLIVLLASITIVSQPELLTVLIQSEPVAEELAPLDVVTDITYSDSPSEEIGANSDGLTGMALSSAPVLSDVSETPSIPMDISSPTAAVNVAMNVKEAVGLTESPRLVRGMTGVGTTGTDGAVDRITYEILQSIEERPTLVVWLFDSSISMVRRRKEIRDRFDRIYKELGIVQEAKNKQNKGNSSEDALLTSIVSFGHDVKFISKKPTPYLEEIRQAIDKIEVDESGVEMVFHAVAAAVDKYKGLRVSHGGNGPERNVMLITITDERGDDLPKAEEAIAMCRKFAIPSYVLGVPAPFGREFTYIKFVDPDPKFDQTPDWRQVDQGPETLFPERVQIGYQDNYFEEPVVDSGFGPYALSRMCYETGGIYFSIHPNRKVGQRVEGGQIEAFASRMSYFFAPDVMDRYRPDYLSESEYKKQLQKSPMRQALLQAVQLSRVGSLEKPKQVFVKRDEANFTRELTVAQQESARLSPELTRMCMVLSEGEKFRSKESSPRWLASYDLSYGTALAAKVRAESYNAMLAKAKRGMNFANAKDNTWNLKHSDTVSVDSKLEKEAKLARELLKGVVEHHPGTPWSLLAARELDHKMGWEWSESFTDLNPPPRPNRAPPAANTPAPAQDDKARMLAPPPPKRPITKI